MDPAIIAMKKAIAAADIADAARAARAKAARAKADAAAAADAARAAVDAAARDRAAARALQSQSNQAAEKQSWTEQIKSALLQAHSRHFDKQMSFETLQHAQLHPLKSQDCAVSQQQNRSSGQAAVIDAHTAQNDIECGVCFESFATQGDHVPMLLSCGHTLCMACVCHIASPPATRATDIQSTKDTIVVCAVCRTQTVLPANGVNGLKMNEAVIGVLKQLDAEQAKHQANHIACENYDGNPAVVHCQVCKANFCEQCFGTTHASRVMKLHTTTAVGKSRALCDDHKIELNLYCNTCSKSVCFSCHFDGPCKRHNVERAPQVAGKQRQILREWHQKLQRHDQTVTNQINQVNGFMTECTQSLDTTTQNIKTTTKQLQEAIKRQEAELLDFVKKQGEAKLKAMQLHKDNLIMMYQCIHKMTSLCDSLIQVSQQEISNDPIEFVSRSSPCVSQAASVAAHSTELCDMDVVAMLADQSPVMTHITTLDKMNLDCSTLVRKMKQWMLPPLPRFVEVDAGLEVSTDGLKITHSSSKDNNNNNNNNNNNSSNCDSDDDNNSNNNTRKFAFSKAIAKRDSMWWRVKIVSTSNDWMFVGIISTNDRGSNSFESKSSFGWSSGKCSGECWINGSRHDFKAGCNGDWDGWQQGDEAIMRLDCESNTLSMKHMRSNTVHCINVTPGLAWKIHINLGDAVAEVEVLRVAQF